MQRTRNFARCSNEDLANSRAAFSPTTTRRCARGTQYYIFMMQRGTPDRNVRAFDARTNEPRCALRVHTLSLYNTSGSFLSCIRERRDAPTGSQPPLRLGLYLKRRRVADDHVDASSFPMRRRPDVVESTAERRIEGRKKKQTHIYIHTHERKEKYQSDEKKISPFSRNANISRDR